LAGESIAVRIRSVANTAVQGVIWLSPSSSGEHSVEFVAEILRGRAEIAPKGLEIWKSEVPVDYSIALEVDAVRSLAEHRGWAAYHLVGFSAGATVVLAAVLRGRMPVRSLTVIEPATIGDDEWSADEVLWRRRIAQIFALSPAAIQPAFRAQMLRSGAAPPPPPPTEGSQHERSLLLEEALRNTGFSSDELKSISQPVLVVTGGVSHPRFTAVARRLGEVLPDPRLIEFPTCSHLRSPQRHEPQALSGALVDLWDSDRAWKVPVATNPEASDPDRPPSYVDAVQQHRQPDRYVGDIAGPRAVDPPPIRHRPKPEAAQSLRCRSR
jgi:pimeloyl-ACP methyl ester carboxylesterase